MIHDLFSSLALPWSQIVQRTPLWVWGLLLALVVLGGTQCVRRTIAWQRAMGMPAGMTAFSLVGVVSSFGSMGTALPALGAWLVAAALVIRLALWWQPLPPAGTSYRADTRRFDLPGSAVPLWLILGIFLTKYVVGIAVALHPELGQTRAFALQVAALYGVFSGIFMARAARLWQLARWSDRVLAAPDHPRSAESLAG